MNRTIYDPGAGTVTLIRGDGEELIVAIGEEVSAAASFFPPDAGPVPDEITMRQARLALLGAGLLHVVDGALAALPTPTKEAALIEWEYSSTVKRTSPLIAQLGPALGLTSAQVDDLFRQGAKL